MEEKNIEKQLRKIKISDDGESVEIDFVELVMVEENGESVTKAIPHKVKGPFRPHKDLLDSMKKLRKHAFNLIDLEVDSKYISNYTVSSLKISGDYLLKQSRVVMMLTKETKSGKNVPIGPLPQVTMYPSAEEKVKYFDAEAMTEIIEDIIEEIWSYLRGKYDMDVLPGQTFPIFTRGEGEYIQTVFTK